MDIHENSGRARFPIRGDRFSIQPSRTRGRRRSRDPGGNCAGARGAGPEARGRTSVSL